MIVTRTPLIFGIILSRSLYFIPHLPNENTEGAWASGNYYSVEDFKSVGKFDIHIHINTLQDYFLSLAAEENFQFLDIVDDRPFGVPMEEQQRLAVRHMKAFPERMQFASTFPVSDWSQPHWVDSTLARLDRSFQSGAIAVKIWKNIGMDLRNSTGEFIMVSNPRIDTVLQYLEKRKIPLIGHNGEPRDCWLPLEKMTFSQGYYKAHPEYHMYLHPEYPSYEDQIRARDSMVKKHPALRFMGAHLGSLEWSLDELANRLDAYPNMSVDLTRMANLKLHALKNHEKTRRFFIKYKDRLIYGTDTAINATENPGEVKKAIRDKWLDDWEFFVTDNTINLPGFGRLTGLKLPRRVVDKIYLENAQAFLGMPEEKNKK
jgi:hypothetical protein